MNHNVIQLNREASAMQIPSGEAIMLPAGMEVV
jgi:hypothetical protein